MIETFNFSMDQFGYYQVGDLRTYSKLEAAEIQKQINQSLYWRFNDEVYTCYNWREEPIESLSELYRQRAQQLRDKYDYLVIWFSGGADSSNVLNSFIDNDIKIDEVVSYVNDEATRSTDSWLNAEVYHVATKKANIAKQKQPHLKHRLLDLSKFQMEQFNTKSAKFDWIYYMNWYFGPNNLTRQEIKTKVPDWAAMINNGMRVGFVHGTEKPNLFKVKNHWYFRFNDIIDHAVSPLQQIKNPPGEYDELFYWTPDLPKLVIKQAHVFKNFVKEHMKTHKVPFHPTTGKVETGLDGDKQLHFDLMHKVMYPGWYAIPFQFKAPSPLFTPRDNWFYKLPENDPSRYSWRTGLDELWKRFPDAWKKDPNDISKGFVPLYSRPYDLGI